MTFKAVTTVALALLLLGFAPPAQAVDRSPCENEPEPLSDGGFKIAFALSTATVWQPTGGEVHFTLKGDDVPADDMKLYVCFRWHGTVRGEIWDWYVTPPARIVKSAPKEVTLAVLVPQELNDKWPHLIDNLSPHRKVATSGFGLVPLADMHVVATSEKAAWRRMDLVQQVGITHRWFALIPASIAIVIAWAVFLSWGRTRGIHGGLVLRIICSPNGIASLSQFQIMLWTLVVSAGAVYVMALSGSLIDIPQTMLGLLGISGVATLGAKLSASGAAVSAPPNPPGAVSGLAVSGTATDTSVTLTWTPPAQADATAAYTVQVRPAGTLPWSTAAMSVAAPPYAVTGLAANTAYEFQVFAVNTAGSGPASQPVQATTAALPSAAPGAPGPIASLIATPAGTRAASAATLTWTGPVPAPSAYVVQYRPAGTWTWATATGAASPGYTVAGLDGGTDYEFQVFAVNAGIAGAPSPVASLRTLPRHPRWSDLVVTGHGSGELDVTRLQMLLFTLIAAAFVALKLFDESQIPDIPTGMLTLMTLSNGVYLAAKFVPGPR